MNKPLFHTLCRKYKDIYPTYQSFAAPHKREVNITQERQTKEYNDQIIHGVKASINQCKLPFKPMTFIFKNINYSIDLPKVYSKFI
jgi:hypothetical protein